MREHFNVQVEVRLGDRIMVHAPSLHLNMYAVGCTGVVQDIVLNNETRRPVGVRVKWDKGQPEVKTTVSMLYFTEFMVMTNEVDEPKPTQAPPFWNPRSGFLGGLLMGVLLAALAMGIAYYWGNSAPLRTPYREFKL